MKVIICAGRQHTAEWLLLSYVDFSQSQIMGTKQHLFMPLIGRNLNLSVNGKMPPRALHD